MHILCVDDDLNFCQMMEKEAKDLGIQMSIADSKEQAEIMMNENIYAQIVNSKFQKTLSDKENLLSLIYQDLPDIQRLKELKSNPKINFVSGKPMSSNEAHYLLSKLCKKANKLEPYCDWLHEIPENLLDEYLKLSYERLKQIADLITKIKQNPSPEIWNELKNVIHKISGSAGSYGRAMASNICKDLELQLKNKNYANIDLESFYRQLYLYIQ